MTVAVSIILLANKICPFSFSLSADCTPMHRINLRFFRFLLSFLRLFLGILLKFFGYLNDFLTQSPFQPSVFPVCTGTLRLFLGKILVQQLYNLVIVHTYGTELAVKRGQPHIKINRSFVNLNGFIVLSKMQDVIKCAFTCIPDLSKRARKRACSSR
jgi:hypothetical protein